MNMKRHYLLWVKQELKQREKLLCGETNLH